MSLLYLVIVLIVIGVVLYLINNYLPIDGKIKQIINIVIVIAVIVWLLNLIGLFGSASHIRIR